MSKTSKMADGGQAFPSHPDAYGEGCGMTLRDYFAATVVATVWVDIADDEIANAEQAAAHAADIAYLIADAMLVERAKGHA